MAAEGDRLTSMGRSSKVSMVHLDGLVVLKIIKHCRESLPTLVAGCMLGLGMEHTLEVTNCFPFPSDSDDSGQDYLMEMLKAMRAVNVDHQQVGWYQSTYMGQYCTHELVSTQFEYQENIGDNAVVVMYDPARASHGSLSLKAYRLTDKFMALYRVEKFLLPNSVKGAPIASSEIFEEVPIRIHNAPLARALLLELQDKKVAKPVDFARLDLSTASFLEKKMQFLIEQVEDLADWQAYASRWERKLYQQRQQQSLWLQKRAAENAERKERGEPLLPEVDPSNPIFKPIADALKIDRLDSLLITAQVGSYCHEINNFAGQSFSKLFLAGKLNEGTRA